MSDTELNTNRKLRLEIESLRQRVTTYESRILELGDMWHKENDEVCRIEAELAALKQAQSDPVYYEITLMDGTRFVAANRSILEGANSKPLYTTPTIPEGWRVVPINPTNEMILAAVKGQSNRTTVPRDDELAAGMYYDMLAAAPKPEE